MGDKSLTVGGAVYFTGGVTGNLAALALNKVDVNWASIRNLNTTRPSGPVRIALVVSTSASGDFSVPFWTLGSVDLPGLPPGGEYGPQNNVVAYHPPPDGEYYMYVVAFEAESPACGSDAYCPDDYRIFGDHFKFVGGKIVSTESIGQIAVPAVEFYHADFDHYFLTAERGEIAMLDLGNIPGWVRTGYAFNVWTTPIGGGQPVCRFYSEKFAPKSTHFYTTYGPECDLLRANRDWVDEKVGFWWSWLVGSDGSCYEQGMLPLYRLYNNGSGGAPNHRYTTDQGARTEMIRRGWIPEGTGPGVVACVPVSNP